MLRCKIQTPQTSWGKIQILKFHGVKSKFWNFMMQFIIYPKSLVIYNLLPVCFSFPNPKIPFWRKQIQNAHLVRYKMQLFGKELRAAFWKKPMRQLPNYPSIDFALVSSPSYSCSSVTDQHRSRKYQPNTNTVPPNYHQSTTTTHFNIW